MMSFKIFLIFTIFITFCKAAQVHDLSREAWFLRDAGGRYVDLLATVPGGVYSDLMQNSIIDDILYGNNDDATRWVPRLNWIYYTTFRIGSDLLAAENVNIVFDGLDTFANIIINGVKVGESQNMFVQYIFDVKNVLKAGENDIEIQFLSPIEVAADLAREQNRTYNIPVNCPPNEYRGECHVNMIRKTQASFSWNLAPSFPSVGIWKGVRIESYDESVIRYIVTDSEERATAWALNIDVYFANNVRQRVVGRASYLLNANTISVTRIEQVNLVPNQYNELVLSSVLLVPKSYVYPWWPNGYGGPSVYNLTITFTSSTATETDSKTVRVGFKTIELIQDAVGSGLTFYFKINGVPIFAKGSNVVPVDILPERGQDRNLVNRVLRDAASTHTNMIRVWGGGVYESDYFYDLADELGMLVWQDFMFASSLYPVNENYLNNVIDEVRHQVKRLRSHASIALFSGNNENEEALRQNWYDTQSNFEQYRQDYVKLYVDTIKNEYTRLTHDRGIFISSSPTNGERSEDEGHVAQQPDSPFYGDIHYYSYYLDSFDSSIYPIPRFASGYGYQSLPSVSALLTATHTISDLNINSAFLDHRQHHPNGNSQLLSLLDIQFKLPDERSPNFYKGLIYYSQVLQAVSVRIETEHYRRYRGIVNEIGQGNTMGALYWQLNDVWVAPTWSSVDYTGKWKILQYFAAEFFAPTIITGHIDGSRNLQVYAVNDIIYPMGINTASIRVFRWDSFDAISEDRIDFEMEAATSHLLTTFNIDNYLVDKGCGSQIDARRNCFIFLTLYRETVIQVAPSNFVLPDKIKNSQVQQAVVTITDIRDLNEGIFEIVISSNGIALFVWFDSGRIRGRFSANGFIEIGRGRSVYFYADQPVTMYQLWDELTVTHLLDSQYFVD